MVIQLYGCPWTYNYPDTSLNGNAYWSYFPRKKPRNVNDFWSYSPLLKLRRKPGAIYLYKSSVTSM